jgi:hypothetical protein
MSIYLSQQTLKEAVDRLAVATVQSSLIDYLIFKRALKITQEAAKNNEPVPVAVVTGTKSRPFVRAIEELTLRIPLDSGNPENSKNPYYVPFGSKRDKTLGYRTKKFPSNGPSDTVSRWQSRSAKPIVLVPGTSPKAYRFERRTRRELEEFFIVKGAADHFSGEKPSIYDAAIWWLRFDDLEEVFDGEPTIAQMVELFIEYHYLTDDELSALFTDEEATTGFFAETSEDTE